MIPLADLLIPPVIDLTTPPAPFLTLFTIFLPIDRTEFVTRRKLNLRAQPPSGFSLRKILFFTFFIFRTKPLNPGSLGLHWIFTASLKRLFLLLNISSTASFTAAFTRCSGVAYFLKLLLYRLLQENNPARARKWLRLMSCALGKVVTVKQLNLLLSFSYVCAQGIVTVMGNE